jgi:hypothetical protein
MKKATLLIFVCLLFGLKGYSQFSFGVAPGLSTNTAYFGYKAGIVVPYVGFQYAHIGVNIDFNDHYWDGVDWVTESNDMKINGNLYIPTLGAKVFAIQKNKLKAYFNLSLTKPMIRAKAEQDGTEIEEVGEEVKKIKLFGGEFGFGVEYFFDDNFSLGGEFGIHYMNGKYDTENVYEYNGEDRTETTKYNISLAPTYSRISLNFYFGGGSAE